MRRFFIFLLLSVSCQPIAGAAEFKTGPVFSKFGQHASVPGVALDKSTRLKVVFDAKSAAEPGSVNRKFDSLARFINMHVANGVPAQNINLALVVHGGATLDLLNAEAYQQKHGGKNANLPLVKALLQHGVRIILCGQAMKRHGLAPDMLIDGVEVELSAMTAHALLQQQGYTLNPF